MEKRWIRMRLCVTALLWLIFTAAAIADTRTTRGLSAVQDYAAAIGESNAALAENPANPAARFLKGLALARSGDNEAALALFEALAADAPGMAQAWNNLGVLRARNGNLVGALEALQKAAALDPQHAPAQENLGDIHVALARQAYVAASRLRPGNRAARAKGRQLSAFLGIEIPPATVVADTARTEPPAVPNATSATPAQVDVQANAQGSVREAPMPEPLPAASSTSDSRPAPVKDTASVGETEKIKVIRAALLAWAQAWSARDLESYFDGYSDDFNPKGDRSVTAWTRLRNNRLTVPETIDVTLSDIDVTLTSADSATVRFDQRYRSSLYQDQERKTVTMVRGAEGWVITSES